MAKQLKKVHKLRNTIHKLEKKFNKSGRRKIGKKITRKYNKLRHTLFGKRKRGPHSEAHKKAISEGLKRYHHNKGHKRSKK